MTQAKGKTPTGDAPAPTSEPDVAAPSTTADAADAAATTDTAAAGDSSTTPPADEADKNPTVDDAGDESGAADSAPATLSETWAAKREEVPEGEVRDFMDQLVAELGDKRDDETDAEYDARADQYLVSREWEIGEDGMPRRIPAADEPTAADETCEHGFTRGFKCPSGCWS